MNQSTVSFGSSSEKEFDFNRPIYSINVSTMSRSLVDIIRLVKHFSSYTDCINLCSTCKSLRDNIINLVKPFLNYKESINFILDQDFRDNYKKKNNIIRLSFRNITKNKDYNLKEIRKNIINLYGVNKIFFDDSYNKIFAFSHIKKIINSVIEMTFIFDKDYYFYQKFYSKISEYTGECNIKIIKQLLIGERQVNVISNYDQQINSEHSLWFSNLKTRNGIYCELRSHLIECLYCFDDNINTKDEICKFCNKYDAKLNSNQIGEDNHEYYYYYKEEDYNCIFCLDGTSYYFYEYEDIFCRHCSVRWNRKNDYDSDDRDRDHDNNYYHSDNDNECEDCYFQPSNNLCQICAFNRERSEQRKFQRFLSNGNINTLFIL
jgi:hypothetical protein